RSAPVSLAVRAPPAHFDLPLTPSLASDRRSRNCCRASSTTEVLLNMSFTNLGLKPELSRAVAEKGYVTPTPIQREAIPAVLAGRDVLAGAQTGTGKTAAFVLPILQNLGAPHGRVPARLVRPPTRDLAAQVAASAEDYGRFVQLRTVVVFGGVSERPQIEA